MVMVSESTPSHLHIFTNDRCTIKELSYVYYGQSC